MREFVEENREFLEFFNTKLTPAFRRGTRPTPPSASRFRPGKVFAIKYDDGNWRMVFIVGKRGKSVYTLSTTKNTLVSCFTLGGVSNEIIQAILQNLYNNEQKSSYLWITKRLKKLIGSRNYRTYNIKKMESIFEITMNIEKEEAI
tara:strand:+ start:428 stop:865 length:438 start_codon:yes stop_codon:yes gene_type:complete